MNTNTKKYLDFIIPILERRLKNAEVKHRIEMMKLATDISLHKKALKRLEESDAKWESFLHFCNTGKF